MDDVIRIRELRRRYPGAAHDAVDGLDLDVHRGELVALLGPDGAGKTTTVEVLEGLRRRRLRPRPRRDRQLRSGHDAVARGAPRRAPRARHHARNGHHRHRHDARPVIDIVLADDHLIVREGLRGMLLAEADLRVVGEAGSGPEAVALVGARAPDVVLMDLRMPGTARPRSPSRATAACSDLAQALVRHARRARADGRIDAAAVAPHPLVDVEQTGRPRGVDAQDHRRR